MPQEYTRSRAKVNRNYDEDDRGGGGGYSRYGNGGSGIGRNRYMLIAYAVIAVIVIVALVLLIKSLFGSAPTGNDGQTTAPLTTESPEPSDTPLPTETPLIESPSPTVSPTGTPDPSASPDNAGTSDPDDTASTDPTDTPDPDSHSGDSDSKALTAPAIKGKADVTDTLSLRSSASSTASVVVKIPKDETFTILEVSTAKTWLKVKYSGKTGYVPVQYVKIGSESAAGNVCTVTGTTVNVRKDASKTANVLGTLKKGDTVKVLSEKTVSDVTWCKVSVGSTTGYITKEYCRVAK